MHDPMTMIGSAGPFTLWHVDPCKDGSDDSCGWFMRAKHGKKHVLQAIKKRMDFDFDRTWTSWPGHWDEATPEAREAAGIKPRAIYNCGLFCPNGDPHYSVSAIVLNLFQAGAWCYFKDKHGSTDKAWKHSRKWMQEHVAELLLFAENPTDSLTDGITGKFRIACGEKWNRDDALNNYASCIYGWILRSERKWYQHPRWHIHNWSLRISWWWFIPRWLDRKVRPENYACNAVNARQAT